MNDPRYGSRRRLRSEILPLASVICLSLAVWSFFPEGIFRFRARTASEGGSPQMAGCAFVVLTAEEEAAAIASARTSWQTDARTTIRRRIEMSTGELPVVVPSPAVELGGRTRPAAASRATAHARLLPPTAAAPSPMFIPIVGEDAPRHAFSREVMLKID